MRLSIDREYVRRLFTQELWQRRHNKYHLHNADDIHEVLRFHQVYPPEASANDVIILPVFDLSGMAHVQRGFPIVEPVPVIPLPDPNPPSHTSVLAKLLGAVTPGIEPPRRDVPDPRVGRIRPPLPQAPGGLPMPQPHSFNSGLPHNFTNRRIAQMMGQLVPEVLQMMQEFPGHVWIAGGSLYNIYRFGEIGFDGDIDVFFCAATVAEAEAILRKGMDLHEQFHNDPYGIGRSKVAVSPMVVTTCSSTGTKVQFMRRLYPEGRPDTIVGAFDLHPCQILWSLETGIMCTTAALASLATQTFPLDLSRRSLSFGKRLEKYVVGKQCDLLLPGVNLSGPPKRFGRSRQNGHGEVFTIFPYQVNKYSLDAYGSSSDYALAPEEEEKKEVEFDKETEPNFYRNMETLLREGMNVELSLKSYKDFCTGNIDFERSVLGNQYNYEDLQKTKIEKFRKLFKDHEDFKAFCIVHFIEKDATQARALWEKNCENLVAYLKPLFGEGASPLTYWKVDDPGAQCFGQNFPRIIDPETYYRGPEYYNVTAAGLPSFTYWSLKQICTMYHIPRDIFRMLCYWSFKAEADDCLAKLGLF